MSTLSLGDTHDVEMGHQHEQQTRMLAFSPTGIELLSGERESMESPIPGQIAEEVLIPPPNTPPPPETDSLEREPSVSNVVQFNDPTTAAERLRPDTGESTSKLLLSDEGAATSEKITPAPKTRSLGECLQEMEKYAHVRQLRPPHLLGSCSTMLILSRSSAACQCRGAAELYPCACHPRVSCWNERHLGEFIRKRVL
jgi:hypothetical protein